MDLDRMKSVEVYDPIKKCHYEVLLPSKKVEIEEEDTSNDEEVADVAVGKRTPTNSITVWSHTETLALINIFSLFKDKFKTFKKRREQWKFISEELAKIGIKKIPEKCEIKWKNLLRVYRQHKIGNKAKGTFEFFNELDQIIANDNQYKYVIQYTPVKARQSNSMVANGRSRTEQQNCPKTKCRCLKSDRQKRHEDRMAIMTKKMELEERKVKAFEDYVQFLKANFRSK